MVVGSTPLASTIFCRFILDKDIFRYADSLRSPCPSGHCPLPRAPDAPEKEGEHLTIILSDTSDFELIIETKCYKCIVM